MKYYVYIYCDPRYMSKGRGYAYLENKLRFSYLPFYVGCGSEKRIMIHLKINETFYSQATERIRILAKKKLKPILLKKKFLIKEKALKIEEKLIKAIGRKDLKTGPLLNKTDGGEKNANYSPKTKNKLRKAILKSWENNPNRKNEMRKRSKRQWDNSKYREKILEKRRKFTNNQENKILKIYENENITHNKLAIKFDVSITTIRRALYKARKRKKIEHISPKKRKFTKKQQNKILKTYKKEDLSKYKFAMKYAVEYNVSISTISRTLDSAKLKREN